MKNRNFYKTTVLILLMNLLVLCSCSKNIINDKETDIRDNSDERIAQNFFISEKEVGQINEYCISYENIDGTVDHIVCIGNEKQHMTIVENRIYYWDTTVSEIVSLDFWGENKKSLKINESNGSLPDGWTGLYGTSIVYWDDDALYCKNPSSDEEAGFLKISLDLEEYEYVTSIPNYSNLTKIKRLSSQIDDMFLDEKVVVREATYRVFDSGYTSMLIQVVVLDESDGSFIKEGNVLVVDNKDELWSSNFYVEFIETSSDSTGTYGDLLEFPSFIETLLLEQCNDVDCILQFDGSVWTAQAS